MAPKKNPKKTSWPKRQGPARRQDADDVIRELELQVRELEITKTRTIATMEAIAERTRRKVNDWYENILRTVPEEILNRPFLEELERAAAVATPQGPMAPEWFAIPGTSGPHPLLAASNYRGKEPANTKQKPDSDGADIAEADKADEACSRPLDVAQKLKTGTPVAPEHAGGDFPVIRPQFDIREKPPKTRKPQPGEILISLRGSPVSWEEPKVPESLEEESFPAGTRGGQNTQFEKVFEGVEDPNDCDAAGASAPGDVGEFIGITHL